MSMHFQQNSKKATNQSLLNLLTRRSAKSTQNLHAATKSSNNRNIWPGKFAPSLANISIKKSNHKNNPIDNIHDNKTKSKDVFYRSDNMKYVKYMPMVKLGSTSLSLMPTARSKTIAMSSTWRTTNNNKFFTVTQREGTKQKMRTSNEFGMQKPRSQQKSEAQTSQFKNSKVCQLFKNEQLQTYKKKSLLELVNNYENQIAVNLKNKQKSYLNDYVIDYKAFNYIQKVIDNPEKWGKFVHKNTKDKDFITSLPQQRLV